jgi:hypothetical protein
MDTTNQMFHRRRNKFELCFDRGDIDRRDVLMKVCSRDYNKSRESYF